LRSKNARQLTTPLLAALGARKENGD